MNRDAIKYIAAFAMLLNHIAAVLLPQEKIWYWVFTDIGYFTAVVMCYFLVEGFRYTRSVSGYQNRILLFALISQLPYCMAFAESGVIQMRNLNMLFTLYLCTWIIRVMHTVTDPRIRGLTAGLLTLATVLCDWPLQAAVYTLLFVWADESRKKKWIAFVIGGLALCNTVFSINEGRIPLEMNLICTAGAFLAVLAAGYCIQCLYNGERMQIGRTFSKWFFYGFYPVHLLVLALVRIAWFR